MHEEINSLVQSLKSLHKTLNEKGKMQSKETQTLVCISPITRLPKFTIMKIFTFLDFRSEIPVLLETCKYFNSIISSRPFSLYVYKTANKKLDGRQEKIQQDQESKETDVLALQSKDEILKSLKTTSNIKKMLLVGIQKSEEKLRDLVKSINKINDDLRIQRQINAKTIKQKDTKETEFLDLKKNIKYTNFLIDNCKKENNQKIESLTNTIKNIENSKRQSRVHIKVLQAALAETKISNASLIKKNNQCRENLLNLKNYCNEMLIPKIKKIETQP